MRLLLIIGPPAVGKMTVGREITRRSSYRLFHNHHTIEPLVEVFGHGTPPFTILNSEFRRRVIEEAAAHGVDLIFTFVWQLEDPADEREVRTLVAPYEEAGGEVLVVELSAGLATRLERNRGEDRIAAKPTKRDVEWSDRNVRELERYRLNSDPTGERPTPADGFLREHAHLHLDTTALSASQTAERVLAWLDQLRVPASAFQARPGRLSP
jgi:hypothetical protein